MSGLRKPRNRGPKGPIGLTGVAGPAGSTSLSSATPIWFDGQDADDVFPIPGPAGPIGAAGANGAPGAAGANGVNGLAGVMGMPGLDGLDGEDAIAPLGWPAFGVTTVTSAVTGALNDYNPGLGKFTVEHWSGAADAAFTGLRGGAAGHIYIFKNIGAKIATFAHLSGASAAGNKYQLIVTSGVTPVAPGGFLAASHDGTTWNLIAHETGAWIPVAYLAGNFTGDTLMTWTVDAGDVKAQAFKIVGKSIVYQVYLDTTTVGGTPSFELRVALPNGYTAVRTQLHICNASDGGGGGPVASLAGSVIGQSYVRFFKNFNGANWSAGAGNDVYARCQFDFEVN